MSTARQPLVSVVTPSFNQGRFIERTLRSVLCQDYPAIEYIVVDGLSSDDTAPLLEMYDDSLDLLIRERDDGLADALQKGFARARGEILTYLNADDCYIGPGIVARAVACFARHPRAEVVFGCRVIVDAVGNFVSRWPYVPFDAAVLRQVDFIPQECTFWRRSLWERAGSYVDRSLRFALDYELWLRFLSCGARFVAINEAFGLFREHGQQKSQARWRDEGWPEVQQLHRRYGFAVTEMEMETTFDRLAFGTGIGRQWRRAWHALGDRRAQRKSRGRPIDGWALDRPIPARRRSALSA